MPILRKHLKIIPVRMATVYSIYRSFIIIVNLVRTFLEVNMDFVDTLQYDKRIIQTSEDIYPFSIRYPNAAISKNLFSILSSLNSFEQGKHDFNTFRQFKAPLKDQKKLWE